MDMKIDQTLVRIERERRAWTQEYLSEVSSLSLRTIQRIEKTGAASFESARALAAVFSIEVAKLRYQQQPPVQARSRTDYRYPFFITLSMILAIAVSLLTVTAPFF